MGRNWAITIGINGYRNLQRLHYAKRDAEALRDFFQRELQISTAYHFTDDSEPIPQDHGAALDSFPSYATLRRFLRVRFEQPFLRPGDNLWFFFAGHGKRHEDQDYLMPIDADPGDDIEKSTWIPLRYVTDRLRRSGADNIVMLIDACRSGTGQRDGTGFGQEKQQGVITLFACSPWEASYEVDELQQGAFTHALLEGLQLEDEGNCATVERLYARLQRRVPQLTQQYKRVPQTPYGVIEPPTKYHLILLPRKANLSDVVTLKNDALQAELRQDFKLAKQLWIRVLSSSSADEDAIEGIERLARVPATPSLPDPTVAPPPKASGQRTATPVKPTILTFSFDVVTVNAQGQESDRRKGQAQYFTENLRNGVVLELVAIPGGTFQIGSPSTLGQEASQLQHPSIPSTLFRKHLLQEIPEGKVRNFEPPKTQHIVTIKPLLIGKYLVTQAQWRAVTALPKITCDLESNPSNFKGDTRPVEQVSWNDAVEFCARLSRETGHEYRLPSETEWEYACRAGTTTPFHFGATLTTDLANYYGHATYGAAPKGKYRQHTTDVGCFPPNAFGLYDMHGNVSEWCLDHWHENYQGIPADGSAWIEGGDSTLRLLRGGSWGTDPENCRSAARTKFDPDYWYCNVGFRVVCASTWTL